MTVEGKVTATNVAGNSTGTTLINRNPYLYRGYRYDRETGLYYLNSRYFDPEAGRFINADVFVATGQGALGNNMFTVQRKKSLPCGEKTAYRVVVKTPYHPQSC